MTSASQALEADLTDLLERRTKIPVAPDADLFELGVVSSLFAMELVVHLESTYDIAIVGPDLVMENFRSVQAMAALVRRIRDRVGAGTGV